MNFDFYDIIHSVIFFQLTLLIAVLLQKGRKYKTNRILAFFLFAQMTASINAIWWNHYPYFLNAFPSICFVTTPFFFTWGPSMFLFIKTQNQPMHSIKPQQLIHYLPALVLAVYLVVVYWLPVDQKVELIKTKQFFPWFFRDVLSYLIIIQVAIYNIAAIVDLERNSKKHAAKNSRMKEKSQWNKFILYGYFSTCMIYNFHVLASPFFLSAEIMKHVTFIIFAAYFTAILYKAVVSPLFTCDWGVDDVKRNLLLPEQELEKIVEKLESKMMAEKPFLNENFGLKEIAGQMSLNERLLSQAVNECRNQNINDFINFYRIEEAKRIIKENTDLQKTFLEIAFQSGFNSKSAFYLAFKKNTGLTPSEFKNSFSKTGHPAEKMHPKSRNWTTKTLNISSFVAEHT